MEKAKGAWKRFRLIAFESGGLDAVFRHVSNLVVATLILAAGIHAVKHSSSIRVVGILEVEISGYVVAASGVILAVLNLLDGLQKLDEISLARSAWKQDKSKPVLEGRLICLTSPRDKARGALGSMGSRSEPVPWC